MWTRGRDFEEKKKNISNKTIYTLANLLNFKNKEWIQGLLRENKKNIKSPGTGSDTVGIQRIMSREASA